MKTTIISITLKACLALIILASCESHEQKSNDAFDRFKEEKMMTTDSIVIIKETAQMINKTEPAKMNDNPEEWVKFENETEKKILANENKINKIKQTPEANIKLFKKIVRLEKDNSDLKKQLKEYENEVKRNFEKFKEKINIEVNDVSFKIKDLSIKEEK